MKNKTPFTLSREKHLDHMVRVVPLIVLGFAIQSYILLSMKNSLGITSVFVLGGCLSFMIASFIVYDVKHLITFHAEYLETEFFFFKSKIFYKDISSVTISDPKQSFGTLRFKSLGKSHTFFFIDDAESLKAFLENHKSEIQHDQAA